MTHLQTNVIALTVCVRIRIESPKHFPLTVELSVLNGGEYRIVLSRFSRNRVSQLVKGVPIPISYSIVHGCKNQSTYNQPHTSQFSLNINSTSWPKKVQKFDTKISYEKDIN